MTIEQGPSSQSSWVLSGGFDEFNQRRSWQVPNSSGDRPGAIEPSPHGMLVPEPVPHVVLIPEPVPQAVKLLVPLGALAATAHGLTSRARHPFISNDL